MTESPTTSLAEDIAVGRDVLVVTKFHVSPAGFVRGLTALAEAALAAPEGYVRVFVDKSVPMARLHGGLSAAHRTGRGTPPATMPPEYLDRLARAFQPRTARSDAATTRQIDGVAGLVEPLSDRELQVLGLLAIGRSNQQIAGELLVVLDTVKHVGHILDKLGAALADARAIGLLRYEGTRPDVPARVPPTRADGFHPRVHSRVTPSGPANLRSLRSTRSGGGVGQGTADPSLPAAPMGGGPTHEVARNHEHMDR